MAIDLATLFKLKLPLPSPIFKAADHTPHLPA
jgi:hypothetical protein